MLISIFFFNLLMFFCLVALVFSPLEIFKLALFMLQNLVQVLLPPCLFLKVFFQSNIIAPLPVCSYNTVCSLLTDTIGPHCAMFLCPFLASQPLKCFRVVEFFFFVLRDSETERARDIRKKETDRVTEKTRELSSIGLLPQYLQWLGKD